MEHPKQRKTWKDFDALLEAIDAAGTYVGFPDYDWLDELRAGWDDRLNSLYQIEDDEQEQAK